MKPALAITVVLVAVACVGGCTTTGSTPATAPDPTAPAPISTTATASPSTSTEPPTTSTTVDRLTEIQAIFDELEVRRLAAIKSQQIDDYNEVFANDEYKSRSSEAFELVEVLDEVAFRTTAIRLLADGETCIAAELTRDMEQAIAGGREATTVWVLEKRGDSGEWGLSWIGEGWACDGPHPFDS